MSEREQWIFYQWEFLEGYISRDRPASSLTKVVGASKSASESPTPPALPLLQQYETLCDAPPDLDIDSDEEPPTLDVMTGTGRVFPISLMDEQQAGAHDNFLFETKDFALKMPIV